MQENKNNQVHYLDQTFLLDIISIKIENKNERNTISFTRISFNLEGNQLIK